MNIDFKPLNGLIGLAKCLHSRQVRKFTGEPYTGHLAAVAGLAVKNYHLVAKDVSLAVFIAVCWFHDSMEDQGIGESELTDISEMFTEIKDREDFVNGVKLLSDLESGNRQERKALTIKRLSAAPPWVQLIKCADTEHNCESLRENDPEFYYSTMLPEKIELLKSFSNDIAEERDRLLIFLNISNLGHLTAIDRTCRECEKGQMFQGTREVPYRNRKGLLRFLKNIRGNYCTFCANCDHSFYPESVKAIEDMKRKGGSLLPITL